MARKRARLAVGPAAVYLALAPAVVNGDGLGYLKAALAGTIYPGHLAYVPLLALLAKIARADRGRWSCCGRRASRGAGGGVGGVGAGGDRAARFGADRGDRAAAAGLLASWGALSAGSDVEAYVLALAALSVARARAAAARADRAAALAVRGGGAVPRRERALRRLPPRLLLRPRGARP